MKTEEFIHFDSPEGGQKTAIFMAKMKKEIVMTAALIERVRIAGRIPSAGISIANRVEKKDILNNITLCLPRNGM